MIAMELTMTYHVAPNGDFFIDCSQVPCASGLGDLCSGGGTVPIQDVWARIVDYNTPGGAYYDVSMAASLADCINNYNDDKCSPEVTFAHCDPGSFNGLSGCLGGTKKNK